MTREEFRKMAKKGIVLFDGATGSNMLQKGMPRNICVEDWILNHPAELIALQRAYVEAGAEIVYSPTFSANRISLRRYHMEDQVQRLNAGLIALSKQAVEGRACVAGNLTTTGEVLEPVGELEEEELFDAYYEQAKAIYDAGADLIVAETLLAVREAEIALSAVRKVSGDIPFLCTVTIGEDGRCLFGGSALEMMEKLQEQGADAAGINCSIGPDKLEKVVEELAAAAKIPLIVKPNAGIPVVNPEGNLIYDMKAEAYAGHMKRLVERGAQIIGGCCGTTPEYIALLAEIRDAANRSRA